MMPPAQYSIGKFITTLSGVSLRELTPDLFPWQATDLSLDHSDNSHEQETLVASANPKDHETPHLPGLGLRLDLHLRVPRKPDTGQVYTHTTKDSRNIL